MMHKTILYMHKQGDEELKIYRKPLNGNTNNPGPICQIVISGHNYAEIFLDEIALRNMARTIQDALSQVFCICCSSSFTRGIDPSPIACPKCDASIGLPQDLRNDYFRGYYGKNHTPITREQSDALRAYIQGSRNG